MPGEFDELRTLKQKHARELMGRPGVSGVGVEKDSAGKLRLTVHLDANQPEIRDDMPDELEGHSINYIWSGPFNARSGHKT
jgi:hypothetical protein